MVWATCGLVDGLGWLIGASCIEGLLLACWVSFFSLLWVRAVGLFLRDIFDIFLLLFFSLARGFQYIATIGDLYIDHFSLYR